MFETLRWWTLVVGPYGVLALMAVALGRRRGRKVGLLFFGIICGLMGAFQALGFNSAHAAAQQHHYGGATLAAGMTAIATWGLLPVALLIAFLIAAVTRHRTVQDPQP